MGFINDNIKAARKEAGYTQEELATKLGVNRSTYAYWETDTDPEFEMIASIAKICGYKFKDLIDEDFIDRNKLREPVAKYKRERKKLAEVKVVDAEKLGVMDSLQIKAMLRVLLRSHAEIIARQERINISEVLEKMTEAVRSETSDEFDAL